MAPEQCKIALTLMYELEDDLRVWRSGGTAANKQWRREFSDLGGQAEPDVAVAIALVERLQPAMGIHLDDVVKSWSSLVLCLKKMRACAPEGALKKRRKMQEVEQDCWGHAEKKMKVDKESPNWFMVKKAIQNANITPKELQELLDAVHPSMLAELQHGTTLIHVAAAHQEDGVPKSDTADKLQRVLKKAHADQAKTLATVLDSKGQTPLFDCIENGEAEHLEILLKSKAARGTNSAEKRALLEARDDLGRTVLLRAVEMAARSAREDGMSEIEVDCRMIRALIEQKADATAVDCDGWAATHHICPTEENGAGCRAILPGAVGKLADVLELLISKGAPVDTPDMDKGVTPLGWILHFGNDVLLPLVQVLIKYGARPDAPLAASLKEIYEGADTLIHVVQWHADHNFDVGQTLKLTWSAAAQPSTLRPAPGKAGPSGQASPPRVQHAARAPCADNGKGKGKARVQAAPPAKKITLEVTEDEAKALLSIIKPPQVDLLDVDFRRNECITRGVFQILTPDLVGAKAVAEAQSDLRIAPVDSIQIVNAYELTTDLARQKLTENASHFFAAQHLVLNVPGTVVQKVGARDARKDLRGQATLIASADFEPWQIVGPCTSIVEFEPTMCQCILSAQQRVCFLAHRLRQVHHARNACERAVIADAAAHGRLRLPAEIDGQCRRPRGGVVRLSMAYVWQ